MHKNFKGLVSPLIIVVILAISAIGGYFFLSRSGGSLPSVSLPSTFTSNQRATEKDFEFVNDATLKKHFVTQANITDYRTMGTSPGSGLKQIIEVQIRGDSWHRREVEKNGQTEVKNMITIGDTMYLKDYADNKWWKQTMKFEQQEPVEEEQAQQTEPIDFKEQYTNPQITYQSLGKEACANLTCYKYQQYFSDNPEFKRTFWFDDRDFLLRKEQGGFGEFIATIEYSYNGIDIQAPSPTKDIPEGKSIYEYTSAGYNRGAPNVPAYDQLPQFPTTESLNETDYQYPEGDQ